MENGEGEASNDKLMIDYFSQSGSESSPISSS
jgi:hypothetical protein